MTRYFISKLLASQAAKALKNAHFRTVWGGDSAYTLNSRDYKGVMVVVISEGDRPIDGKQPSGKLLRTGRIQRYVCDGE